MDPGSPVTSKKDRKTGRKSLGKVNEPAPASGPPPTPKPNKKRKKDAIDNEGSNQKAKVHPEEELEEVESRKRPKKKHRKGDSEQEWDGIGMETNESQGEKEGVTVEAGAEQLNKRRKKAGKAKIEDMLTEDKKDSTSVLEDNDPDMGNEQKESTQPKVASLRKTEPSKKKRKKDAQNGGLDNIAAMKSKVSASGTSAETSHTANHETETTSISILHKFKTSKISKKHVSKTAKQAAKAKERSSSPEPIKSTEQEDKDLADQNENDEENTHLYGFSTDEDDDSSDDERIDNEPSGLDINRLPTIAKDDATLKWKLDKAQRQPTEDRGVLFLGRLPHGFYEDQMKGYFSQFGNVTRLRISRNKKTGRSKHYGFIEFESSSIAKIVAETMDNYLLMGHILRCKIIPKEEVHPELWVGANRKWRAVPRDRVTRVQHNKPKTEEGQRRSIKRLIKRQNERKLKLASAGIEYDFEAVSYKEKKNEATTL